MSVFLHHENIFLGHFLFDFSPFGSDSEQGVSSSTCFTLSMSMSGSFSEGTSCTSRVMTAVLRTENMLVAAWAPPVHVHEEEVLVGYSESLHLSLDDVACYLDTSVIKIASQPLLMVQVLVSLFGIYVNYG